MSRRGLINAQRYLNKTLTILVERWGRQEIEIVSLIQIIFDACCIAYLLDSSVAISLIFVAYIRKSQFSLCPSVVRPSVRTLFWDLKNVDLRIWYVFRAWWEMVKFALFSERNVRKWTVFGICFGACQNDQMHLSLVKTHNFNEIL